MGDKTYCRTFCTWKEYGMERPEIDGSMPSMPSQNRGQKPYHLMPSSQCMSTMEAQYAEIKPMDERPRHSTGSANGDIVTIRTMGMR